MLGEALLDRSDGFYPIPRLLLLHGTHAPTLLLRPTLRVGLSPGPGRRSLATVLQCPSLLRLGRARPLPLRAQTDRLTGRAECDGRSEEHTSELQSLRHLVCRLLLEKKK